jgi:hypothetical protein
MPLRDVQFRDDRAMENKLIPRNTLAWDRSKLICRASQSRRICANACRTWLSSTTQPDAVMRFARATNPEAQLV